MDLMVSSGALGVESNSFDFALMRMMRSNKKSGANEFVVQINQKSDRYSGAPMLDHLGVELLNLVTDIPMPFAEASSWRRRQKGSEPPIGTTADFDEPVHERQDKRLKPVNLDLLPHRLSLNYEEAAVLLNRQKRYVEDLVKSGALVPYENGRVSRRAVMAYIERLDAEAEDRAKPTQTTVVANSTERPVRPRRARNRKPSP